MRLGNPAMLIGLLLVAIPIIIALLNRQRHREVRWAAMAFLEAALKKNRRRLTIQNLALLLLRTAIILVLVLALARPFLTEGIVPAAFVRSNRTIALVLDRSFSMGHRPGTELSSFDRAKEAATEILRRYVRPGDRLQLFLMDETAEAQYTDPLTVAGGTAEEVIPYIADLEPSHFATDVSRSIRNVLESLRSEEEAGEEGAQTEVFLITDLQRNAWVGDVGLHDVTFPERLRKFGEERGLIRLVDVGSEGVDNLAVHAFSPAVPIITPSDPVQIDAVVRSYAGSDSPDVEVVLVVDGEPRKRQTRDVPAGKQATFSFHHTFSEAGSHSVTAQLAPDHLPVDNERHLAIEVRERVPVLVIDGDPGDGEWESESDFLVAALTPSGGDAPGVHPLLEVTVVTVADLGGEDLDRYAVVVLANVAALADDQVRSIDRYVSAGGGLLVALGDEIDAAFYTEAFYREGKGLLPAAPGEGVGEIGHDAEGWMTPRVEDLDHPALKFFDPARQRTPLGDVVFLRCDSTAAIAPEGRVLIRLAEQTDEDESGMTFPLLIERSYGRGRSMLWTSTIDDGWNFFPRSWTYVAMMQLVAVYLSDTASVRRNLTVGDPYEEVVPPAEYADQVTLMTPGHDVIAMPLTRDDSDGSGRFRISHESCLEAGIYSILFSSGEAESSREEYFAVNLRTEESDLVPIDFDEIRDLLPAAPLRYVPFDEVAALAGPTGEGAGAAGIWKFLLALVVAFLVVETAFARLMGR